MILPPELIRVRRTKTALSPLFADDEKLSLAKTLIAIYKENRFRKRAELDEALSECEELGYNFKLVRGLSAVLDSCSVFEARSFIPPIKARTLLFEEAARRSSITDKDRSEIMAKVALGLGITSQDLEENIYADLIDEQRLTEFREPAPDELLQLYNFVLASVVLAYSTHISISYSGKNERLEKAASALGELNIRINSFELNLKPSKKIGIRGSKIEALLANLLESKEWRLLADVVYPTRHRETRPLELNRRSHGGMLRAWKAEEETIIEIKSPVRKSSYGDLIIIDDVANRLGLTDRELIGRIEAEKVKYVRLPGILVTPEKQEQLRSGLEELEGGDLASYKAFLKGQGCKNPVPVLEAFGYFVDVDYETGRPKVKHLRRRASS
jgi:predicted nuclease of restriction endonuclease-like RecB superfamily